MNPHSGFIIVMSEFRPQAYFLGDGASENDWSGFILRENCVDCWDNFDVVCDEMQQFR